MSELKPCPFGCSQPKIAADNPLNPQPSLKYGVLYEDEQRERKVTVRITASDSACLKHFWNTRPIEDAQAAEINELKNELAFQIRRNEVNESSISEKTQEVLRLTARIAELEKDTDLGKYVIELYKENEALKADNARMRGALQELYNLNLCPDYKTGASSENLFAEIARKALKGEG